MKLFKKPLKRKILAVDDESSNLKLMERYLHLGGFADYEIVLCENGQVALDALLADPDAFDVILLDLMMPVMSGIEFIKKIKQEHAVQYIPVIMQTAASDSASLIEGFKLGIYYYFTKPYMPTVFNSVVRAAIDMYSQQKNLTEELSKTRMLFDCVTSANFSFKTIEEANHLSVGLAQLFPHPEKVVLGIAEILINAVEHGNLNVTYEEKTALNLKAEWLSEVIRRQNLPENKDKTVVVSYQKYPEKIVLNIRDCGEGFDYRPYLDFDLERGTSNHGRGIAFANSISFDSLEFVGKGNEVNCVVYVLHRKTLPGDAIASDTPKAM